ncbi:hypothetical protein [Caldisphaera sp.]|uniref:hypothetical protein n=1 Tax=Caldisphaera sp. TaxID=2060322 RepID=UPI00397B282D
MVNGIKVAEATLLIIIAIIGFGLYLYDAAHYLNPIISGGQYLKSNPLKIQLVYNVSENIISNSSIESGWIQVIASMTKYNNTYDVLSFSVMNFGGSSNIVQSLYLSAGTGLVSNSNIPFIANRSLLINSSKEIFYNSTNPIPVAVENLNYIITQNGTKYYVNYGQYYDLSSGILVYRTFNLTANNTLIANGTMVLQKVYYLGSNNLYINPYIYGTILVLLAIVVAVSLFGAVILLLS